MRTLLLRNKSWTFALFVNSIHPQFILIKSISNSNLPIIFGAGGGLLKKLKEINQHLNNSAGTLIQSKFSFWIKL